MTFKILIFLFSIGSFIPSTYENNPPLRIALVSIDNKDIKEIKKISRYLESYYNCKVDILPAFSVPIECYRNESDTLWAGKVLTHLRDRYKDAKYDKYMAITEQPIYATDRFPFVRGLGEYNGERCIVSTNKIKKEANKNRKLYRTFIKKVARHEIGHTLGLDHCKDNEICVMMSGIDNVTFLNAKAILCDSCTNKLKYFLK